VVSIIRGQRDELSLSAVFLTFGLHDLFFVYVFFFFLHVFCNVFDSAPTGVCAFYLIYDRPFPAYT